MPMSSSRDSLNLSHSISVLHQVAEKLALRVADSETLLRGELEIALTEAKEVRKERDASREREVIVCKERDVAREREAAAVAALNLAMHTSQSEVNAYRNECGALTTANTQQAETIRGQQEIIASLEKQVYQWMVASKHWKEQVLHVQTVATLPSEASPAYHQHQEILAPNSSASPPQSTIASPSPASETPPSDRVGGDEEVNSILKAPIAQDQEGSGPVVAKRAAVAYKQSSKSSTLRPPPISFMVTGKRKRDQRDSDAEDEEDFDELDHDESEQEREEIDSRGGNSERALQGRVSANPTGSLKTRRTWNSKILAQLPGWALDDYLELRTFVGQLVETLDSERTFTMQCPRKIAKICEEVVRRFPRIKRYTNKPVMKDILRTAFASIRAKGKRSKRRHISMED